MHPWNIITKWVHYKKIFDTQGANGLAFYLENWGGKLERAKEKLRGGSLTSGLCNRR